MKWEYTTSAKPRRSTMLAVAIALAVSAAGSAAYALTEVSRTPYQEYVYTTNCVPCALNFANVPKRSRLEISNVSCYIRWDSLAVPMYVDNIQLLVLDATNAIVTASTLAPIPTHTMNPQVQYSRLTFSANHAVSVFATAGQHFRVVTDTTGGVAVSFVACHISGQMVKFG